MDPDEALAIIRRAVEDEAPYDALEAWEALDKWLSNGGFLPKAWARREGG